MTDCVYFCVYHMCARAQGCHKRALDPMELEFQTATWVPGTKLSLLQKQNALLTAESFF